MPRQHVPFLVTIGLLGSCSQLRRRGVTTAEPSHLSVASNATAATAQQRTTAPTPIATDDGSASLAPAPIASDALPGGVHHAHPWRHDKQNKRAAEASQGQNCLDPNATAVLQGSFKSGVDVVAYFSLPTYANATRGEPNISWSWAGYTWHFTNDMNRELFMKHPEVRAYIVHGDIIAKKSTKPPPSPLRCTNENATTPDHPPERDASTPPNSSVETRTPPPGDDRTHRTGRSSARLRIEPTRVRVAFRGGVLTRRDPQ